MERWGSNDWFKLLSRRGKECLAFWTLPVNSEEGKELCGLDVSQRIDRCTRAYDGVMQTLTPNMKMWAREPNLLFLVALQPVLCAILPNRLLTPLARL